MTNHANQASSTTTNHLVRTLKQNGEDFEFYPTTNAMIQVIADDLKNKAYRRNESQYQSILEIGAGDCRVSKSLKEFECVSQIYVIEKVVTHIKNLPPMATLVGTEFLETNLSGIEAEIVFSNPPYSMYELWASNIIANSFASVIYLILPSRWVNSPAIKRALDSRNMVAKIIGTDDFLDADRTARAKVDILRICDKAKIISHAQQEPHRKLFASHLEFIMGNKSDPLAQLFDDFEKIDDNSFDSSDSERIHEIFAKADTIEELVIFYNHDLAKIQRDFDGIKQVSPLLLKKFGVNRDTVLETIKHSTSKLKNDYWSEFLNCYEPIVQRLTRASRNSIYKTLLDEAKKIDFTVSNCYAMTLIAIERANDYTDRQIKNLFETHINKENIAAYKSNSKVFENNSWRYSREDKIAYFARCKLEYRLVCDYYLEYTYSPNAIANQLQSIINDYIVVARTLNMDARFDMVDDLSIGEKIEAYCFDGKAVRQVLFDIRFYKKGTYHIRLGKEFALRLNVAIGKLYGWLNTAKQASDELGEKLADVQAVFEQTTHIKAGDFHLPMLGYVQDSMPTSEDVDNSLVCDGFDVESC